MKLCCWTGRLLTDLLSMQHKATHVTIICKACKATKVLTCKPGMGGAMVPRQCDSGGECGLDPFVTLPNRSKYVDQQTLKLQVIACTFHLHQQGSALPASQSPAAWSHLWSRSVGHCLSGLSVPGSFSFAAIRMHVVGNA